MSDLSSLPKTFWRPSLADIYDEPGTSYDDPTKLYDGLDPVASNTLCHWVDDLADLAV